LSGGRHDTESRSKVLERAKLSWALIYAAWHLIQMLERDFGVDFVSLDGGERLHLLFPENIDPDAKALINAAVETDLQMVNVVIGSRAERPGIWPCATPPTATIGWA
jgi:hypothetical protein